MKLSFARTDGIRRLLVCFAAIMVAGTPIKTVLGGAQGPGLVPVLGGPGPVPAGFGQPLPHSSGRR